MLRLTVESLAGLDRSVLEKIRSRLGTITSMSAQFPAQQQIWLAYLDAVDRFLRYRVNGLDLPRLPSLVDSMEIAKIARLEITDEPTAGAFWTEVIEQIESFRAR
jgi:hypothetical protein